MNRLTLKLASRANYLDAQDMSQVFKILDKDNSGYLNGEEVQEMFNTMCGTEVSVDGALEKYSLKQFTRIVERTDLQYPQFRVSANLMKYLKENLETVESDALCMENCEKLFGIMDKDESGEMNVDEMIKMFVHLGMHKLAWVEAYRESGTITSAEELQTVLKKMDEDHPEKDLGNAVVSFIAEVAADGKPDLSAEEEGEDQPDEEVGNKKALLVGINYLGTSNELGGCINDVRNQKDVLIEHFGFSEDNIMLLTEDQDDDDKRPTGAKIREGFSWLFDGASAGDELFFQYSGHGSQCPDRSGTEPDGKNECICPLDCMDGPWPDYVIIDNEIYNVFYEGLPEGVKCVCVFDCCHSGTISDLQCTREFTFDEEDKSRFLDPPEDVNGELSALEPKQREVADNSCENGEKRLWTFSGCQDNQTSADATINGVRQGALTWAFTESLKTCGWRASYIDLLNATKKNLKGRYTQIPALSTCCEHNFQRFYLGEKPE